MASVEIPPPHTHSPPPPGAIRAPRYVHGVTKASEWLSARAAPAPWGEVGSGKFIITTQRAALGSLADPVGLMNYWDKVGGGGVIVESDGW
jgi:hypothetical protein